MCEDAPCCGCCGAAVEMAEYRAAEEYALDRYNGDDFGPEPDYDEPEIELDHGFVPSTDDPRFCGFTLTDGHACNFGETLHDGEEVA